METKVYNQKGKEVSTLSLPESIFGEKWNADLVHQVVVSMEANKRTPIAHTKDRSEVAGGGKKPWKQKGTGRARHGSSRSPIWVHGGVAHGPRNDKDYSKKINKKMRVKALYVALAEKMRHGEVLFVDTLDIAETKTKNAHTVLQALSSIKGFDRLASAKKTMAHLVLDTKNDTVEKSFRNLPQVAVDLVKDINPVDVLRYKYLIITNPTASLAFLESRMATKKRA
jgi:large subunit ribosomal protein L4